MEKNVVVTEHLKTWVLPKYSNNRPPYSHSAEQASPKYHCYPHALASADRTPFFA